MEENYIYGCECFCGDCLPVSGNHPEVCDGSGEQDSPANCSNCGCPVDYSLTSEGVAYVLEALRDALRESREERDRIMPMRGTGEETMTYWHGSRHIEIVRNWAEELTNYYLSRKDKEFVERFLLWTTCRKIS